MTKDEFANAVADAAYPTKSDVPRSRAPRCDCPTCNSWRKLRDIMAVHGWPRVEDAVVDERAECAKTVRERIIYTGPGGFDPEKIQEALAKAIEERSEERRVSSDPCQGDGAYHE